MNSSRWLWRSTSLISLLATFLFAFALVYAVEDMLHPKASDFGGAPAAPAKSQGPLAYDRLNIVALGDSLSLGTGDQSGNGYVGDVKSLLQQTTDKPVYLLGNFAVSGYRTDQLLEDLQTKQGIADTLAQANIVLLTIGGNDLFQASGMANGIGGEDDDLSLEIDFDAVKQRLPDAVERLKQILARIAAINPQASILYVGLYNPFLDFDTTGEGSLLVNQWNNEAFEAAHAYPNITVVPTYDLFVKNLLKYLYNDHFHPNQEGYQRIAERILQVLS